ncbi:hypothetical protein QYM36_020079 [Artemia franciscana]|uniref:Uncharacterized protein n=1 Tax=Artemia franciscana TaxID=6661 RepID=A0AA88H4A8_ARTSF|nr:hypothetical protein QYM36_020079 [Artemia franciscana]
MNLFEKLWENKEEYTGDVVNTRESDDELEAPAETGSRMPKNTALSEEELRRLLEDDNDEDLSSDSDVDPKDKDWVPDKDGSSLDSDGETPNQESFIEADISAPDPTFPEVTATELDVVDDQASVERRNPEEHPKRKTGCKCKLECKTIDQDARKAILESFWLLGKEFISMESQRQFVSKTFHEYNAAFPSSESTRDALDESDFEEEDSEDL